MVRSLTVLLIFLFTSTGCGLVRAVKPVLPSKDSIVPQPDLVTPDAEPRKVVDEAYRKLCSMKSFRTRTEMTGPTGGSIVTTAEFVAPDRRRAVQFAGTDAEFETISIGPRAYTRSNGKWTEMTGPLGKAYADPGFGCSPEMNAGKSPDISHIPQAELKLVGPAEVNGVKVFMYRSASTMGRLGDLETTISIGVKDGLLYRTESKSSGGDAGIGDITTATTYSDYNADIRIESPV